MIRAAVSDIEADSNGDFIQRILAEVEKQKHNVDSSFYGPDGQLQVIGQMTDIFVAGTVDHKVLCPRHPGPSTK